MAPPRLVLFDDDRPVHVLVPRTAEEVTLEGERPRSGRDPAHPHRLPGRNVGPDIEVRDEKPVFPVGGVQLEDHRLTLLEPDLAPGELVPLRLRDDGAPLLTRGPPGRGPES